MEEIISIALIAVLKWGEAKTHDDQMDAVIKTVLSVRPSTTDDQIYAQMTALYEMGVYRRGPERFELADSTMQCIKSLI